MRILLLLFIALLPASVLAQSDSILSKTVGLMRNQPPDQEIYNGRVHSGYPSDIIGIAYYQTKEWQPGTIVYRDVFYPDVFLKYDLVQNEVILRHFNGGIGVTLFNQRIKEFSLSGRKFVHLISDGTSFPPLGLYEELEKGVISLYVHRSKSILETTRGFEIEKQFIESNSYYALQDGKWYNIKKENTLFSLVRDKKNEIKDDLRKKGLKYRTDREMTLREIVSYYNKANN